MLKLIKFYEIKNNFQEDIDYQEYLPKPVELKNDKYDEEYDDRENNSSSNEEGG